MAPPQVVRSRLRSYTTTLVDVTSRSTWHYNILFGTGVFVMLISSPNSSILSDATPPHISAALGLAKMCSAFLSP